MSSSWKLLLRPLAKAIWLYLGLVFLRELLRLGSNYSMSATFRVADVLRGGGGAWVWVAFLGGMAVYMEVALRIEGATLWYMTRNVNVPLYRRMRNGAFGAFLNLPLRWHQRHNSAVLAGEVNSGSDRILEMVDAAGWEMAPLVWATVLSLAPLLWLSRLSTLVIAAAAVCFLALNYRIYLATDSYRKARCDGQQDDWRLSAECVRRLPALLMANAGPRIAGEYARVQDGLALNTLEECRYEVFRYGRWRDRLMSWAQVGLAGIWLHQLRNNTLTIIDCVYLWRVCEDVFTYMEGYSALFERFANNTESVKRFFAVFQHAPVEQRRAPAEMAAAEGGIEIELRDVCFRYEADSPCLEGLNLTARPGEVLAIVGRSGSGKSTLAKLLCALYQCDAGEIRMNGRGGWSAEEIRSAIAYVPQMNEAGVLERSVTENIRLAVPGAPFSRVVEAATAAGLHDDISRLPAQYDTVIGEGGCTLSGGQAQRLLIARELLKDAPVFILDEPMSGQDAQTERTILRSIMPRLAGKTVILISHRLSCVRRLATRIAMIDGGRIVEQGSERELLRARGAYFRMAAGNNNREHGNVSAGFCRSARRTRSRTDGPRSIAVRNGRAAVADRHGRGDDARDRARLRAAARRQLV